MVREVHEQLRAMVPDWAMTTASVVRNSSEFDIRPTGNRICDTDPRKCASKSASRQDSQVFRPALQVVPQLIRAFCKSGTVSHVIFV